ncbi:MAG: GNAT family N-acetyltransferase [Treponema sp.]|nr:GNAT family N-acetyltransferase [Treponema sp.]
MKTISVTKECKNYDTYRAARVKSLFNAEYGNKFNISVDTDIDEFDWQIGVVVGPSGSGKTSIGQTFFDGQIYDLKKDWPDDEPIIEAINPDGNFNTVTSALSAVGLGSVPSWLRPFKVLSNGEQFRAGLARLLLTGPDEVILDEFTSVVDRQVAKTGAGAFQKSWRRKPGRRAVLLSPHYDILPWLEPDWIIDTKDAKYTRGCLRRPEFELEIVQADGSYWHYFKPHYYLDLPMPIAAQYFIGLVDGEPVAHVAVCPFFQSGYYRATRLVVMPEWQGAGIGIRFLNAVCQWHLDGNGRCGRKLPVLFHTSHPQLAAALRRSPLWIQKSACLYQPGGTAFTSKDGKGHSRYGGHFRAVQGFAYTGDTNA